MSSNSCQIQNMWTLNVEKDAALVLEEEVSTQKSESLIIRIPSNISTDDDESKNGERKSRKRNREQLNILKQYFK